MSYDLRLIDRPRARSARKNKCSDRAVDANHRRRPRGSSRRINVGEAPDLLRQFLDSGRKHGPRVMQTSRVIFRLRMPAWHA